MKKIKKILNILIFKYIYLSILFPLIIICICDFNFQVFKRFLLVSSNISSLAGISGSFIGFLLTVATIYCSLPLGSKFKDWFVKYGHHKIFVRIILFGTLFFMVPIISWICDFYVMNHIGLYCFIAGCLEVLAAIYYLYHLIVKNPL